MDTRKAFEGEYRSDEDQINSGKAGAEAVKTSPSGHRRSLTGFVVLMLAGLLMCAVAVFIGRAPISSPYSEDWLSWARIETLPSGLLVVGLAVILIGIVGCIFRLSVPVSRRPRMDAAQTPATGDDFDLAIPETQLQMSGDGLKVASVHYLSANTPAEQAGRNRASLRFEAPSGSTHQTQPPRVQPAPASHTLIPHYGDNAADAFGLPKPHLANTHVDTVRHPPAEPKTEAPARSVVDIGVLSPEHGLHISGLKARSATVTPELAPTAQVIALRPEPVQESVQQTELVQPELIAPAVAAIEPSTARTAPVPEDGPVIYTEPQNIEAAPAPQVAASFQQLPETISDPIAAALLAETPETQGRDLPPSDINAVISSAMRFIDAPSEVSSAHNHDAYAPAPASVPLAAQAATPAPEPEPVLTPEEEIGQAVSTALSVWPDTTRPIAAEELSVRISYLYYDKSAKSREVFDLISAGDLSAAASRLQGIANELMNAGAFANSAELWRVYGALHMGRDDPKAMMAYEQVSELDPSDANIHLYLARRYQMDGRTEALAPVIGRALAVVSDPQTRSGLLTQYADLKFKVGDLTTAATAFEELSLINESLAYLDPGNLQVRSGHGIALARLAQIREMQGDHHKAAPLYRKAHEVFAELSAQMPGHPGLKSMADNALRDVQRLSA